MRNNKIPVQNPSAIQNHTESNKLGGRLSGGVAIEYLVIIVIIIAGTASESPPTPHRSRYAMRRNWSHFCVKVLISLVILLAGS